MFTGYQCPACGFQRAMHQLLHLNIQGAFSYNPFLVISLPYALLMAFVTWFVRKDKFQKLRRFCYHPITVKIYVVLFVTWWIVRNI